MPQRILIVDDERKIVQGLENYFRQAGYDTLAAYDGRQALDMARREQPDLVVLDVMLPELDGVEVCRRLRQESAVPILMLTARVEETDMLIGLEVGADDYLTKPFSPRELVARVKAILRRNRLASRLPSSPPILQIETLIINPDTREVCNNDTLIELTPREFDLLYTLAQQPGHVFTREELLRRVWGDDFDGIDRVVDVHVGTLRRKLDDDANLIQTVRGVGYKCVGKQP
jgi:two-component system alkaline phosphatase synthesis response regulator PhoP